MGRQETGIVAQHSNQRLMVRILLIKTVPLGIEKALKEHKICLSNVKECFEEVAVIFENNVGGTSGAVSDSSSIMEQNSDLCTIPVSLWTRARRSVE